MRINTFFCPLSLFILRHPLFQTSTFGIYKTSFFWRNFCLHILDIKVSWRRANWLGGLEEITPIVNLEGGGPFPPCPPKCMGPMDDNGCPMAPTCIPSSEVSPSGACCTNTCPMTCAPGDVSCPGQAMENGCTGSGSCMPAGSTCP